MKFLSPIAKLTLSSLIVSCSLTSCKSVKKDAADSSAPDKELTVSSNVTSNEVITVKRGNELAAIAEPEEKVVTPHRHEHGHDCAHCQKKAVEKIAQKLITPVELAKIVAKNGLDKEYLGMLFSAEDEDVLELKLTDSEVATGIVHLVREKAGETVLVQGTLIEPQRGFFFYRKQPDGSLIGQMHYDEGDTAYKLEQHDGESVMTKCQKSDIMCTQLPAAPLTAPAEQQSANNREREKALLPQEHSENIDIPAYQNGVIPLNSLRNAKAVLYLDFDGEEGPQEGWGDFDCLPSGNTNAQIKDIWERVSEDMAPFSINVTTDLQVYLDAVETNRLRVIITPTSDALPGAGGVAYYNSFNWAGDSPVFSFNLRGKYSAETITHESGHALNLEHHGNASTGYYPGHGSGSVSWVPCMGYSYSPSLSQWSKAEYTGANMTNQDDILIILKNNEINHRSDDHGNDYASASQLEVLADHSISNQGVITERTDMDCFKFTTTGGAVDIKVDPSMRGANIDILAEIVDEAGSVIASDNPDTEINARIQAVLPAGNYFLRVDGVGRGDVLLDGYSDYGSLGYYSISGSLAGATLSDRFTIAENSGNGTAIGTITPRNNHGGASLSYTISSSSVAGAVSISGSGVISVADTTKFDYETLSTRFDDPATIELSVAITNSTNSALNETVRVVITVTDVNEAPSIESITPVYVFTGVETGSVIATAKGNDLDRFDFVKYEITAGNTGDMFAIDTDTGEIKMAKTASTTPLSQYTLTISAVDRGTPALRANTMVTVNIIDIDGNHQVGKATQTFYTEFIGSTLSKLPSHEGFPNSPASFRYLTALESSGQGEHYGSMIRAYVIPHISGEYEFFLAGDDKADFRISTDANPANASVQVTLSSATNEKKWDQRADQKSAKINLVAGKPYYIEMRQAQNMGGAHMALAWSGPGLDKELIRDINIAPFEQNYHPLVTDEYYMISNALPNGSELTRVKAHDADTGQQIANYQILSGNTNNAFAIDPITGAVTINDQTKLLDGTVFDLVVQVSDTASSAATAQGKITIKIQNTTIIGTPQKWSNAVDTGTASIHKRTASLTSSQSTTIDLSAIYGNSTFEFIIDSVDTSKLVIPNLWGSGYTVKFEQWRDENKPGVTRNQYRDYPAVPLTGKSAASPYGAPHHIVFVADLIANKTKLYIDGDHVGNVDFAMQIEDANSHLTAANLRADSAPAILGFAAYNGQLSDREIKSHHAAWFGSSNQAPVLADTAFSVPENSATGTVVGTVTATDANSSDKHEYSIISGASDRFSIDKSTGEITVTGQLDFERASSYTIDVLVIDNGAPSLTDTARITINITDVANDDSDNDGISDDWEKQVFGNNQLSNGTTDTDGDGHSDIQEYALNMNPKSGAIENMTAAGNKGLPMTTTVTDAGVEYFAISFVRLKSSSLEYIAEFNNDLGSWSAGIEYSVTSIDATWERVVVRSNVAGLGVKRFGRMKTRVKSN